jgi:hypothetical protein
MGILKYRGLSNSLKSENCLTLIGYEAHIVSGQKVTVIKTNDVTHGRNWHHYPNLIYDKTFYLMELKWISVD